jgi:hypothetical protein
MIKDWWLHTVADDAKNEHPFVAVLLGCRLAALHRASFDGLLGFLKLSMQLFVLVLLFQKGLR